MGWFCKTRQLLFSKTNRKKIPGAQSNCKLSRNAFFDSEKWVPSWATPHHTSTQHSTPHYTTDAQKHRCTDAQMHRCTDAQMHRCTDAQMHRCTDAQTHRRTDAQTHRHTNSQMHKRTVAQTYRCTDGQTHRRTDTQTMNCLTTTRDFFADVWRECGILRTLQNFYLFASCRIAIILNFKDYDSVLINFYSAKACSCLNIWLIGSWFSCIFKAQ